MSSLPISVDVLSRLVGKAVTGAVPAAAGGNSRVYRVSCADGMHYAAKLYFQPTVQGRDRLDVEFTGLRFMWDGGLRCVPKPHAADPGQRVAAYEYVAGAAVPSASATPADIRECVRFAAALRDLAALPGSENLTDASEACFSIAALVANVRTRVNRLTAVPGDGNVYGALSAYLEKELVPALETVERWARGRVGIDAMSKELDTHARTLSPSDFGFHNALRREGTLVFVDFEYFGWDDPAKMIADFVLHPAMALPELLKSLFVREMIECFAGDEALSRRLAVVYPFFGLKWCTIMLNEFVPSDLARRSFASQNPVDVDAARTRQLEKSRAMLRNVMDRLDNFPYLAHAA